MTPLTCPACKADLRELWIEENGERKDGSRVIGVYDRDKDHTTHWKCPDCGAEWERK